MSRRDSTLLARPMRSLIRLVHMPIHAQIVSAIGVYFLRPGFIHFGSLNLRSLLAELVRVEAERVLLDDGSSCDAEACLDSDDGAAVVRLVGTWWSC